MKGSFAFMVFVGLGCAASPPAPQGDAELVARAVAMQEQGCSCLEKGRQDCLKLEVGGITGMELFTRTELTDLTPEQKQVFWSAKDAWNTCFAVKDRERLKAP